jgi:hypothetical protein
MPSLTLLDIAKRNQSDKVVGLVEENLTYAPELSIFPVKTITNTYYDVLIRKTLPAVAFRDANASSVASSTSAYDVRRVACMILGGYIEIDAAVAKSNSDGVDALLSDESMGMMKQSLLTIGKQIYYGNQTTYAQGDAKGFPGLYQFVDSSLVTDAGGTTASTGASVYGVNFDRGATSMVMGLDGNMDMLPFQIQHVSGKPSWVSSLTSWIGLQAVQKYSVSRIKKLTADSGKGLTDAVLNANYALWPVGAKPTVWLASRRSVGQLQTSRTVTVMSNSPGLPSGSSALTTPWPTRCANGIPIITTDSILETEPLTF